MTQEGGQERVYLPVSLVAEVAYCPRNAYLRLIQGEERRNWFMVKGHLEETLRQHAPRRTLPDGTQRVYSVLLGSETLNLIGVVDLVILGDQPVPVEFKTGRYTESHPAHDVQVCLQGMLLEEHLQKPVPFGFVYYTASRKRRQVVLSEVLRQRALDLLEDARRILEGEWVPEPELREECARCALYEVCLPFATRERLQEDPATAKIQSPPRSLQVLHRVLYVDTPGTSLSKRGDTLRIRKPGEMFDLQLPLTQIQQVVLVGNVQISTQLLRVLLARGVPVIYLTGRGRFSGITLPEINRNIPLRIAQFKTFLDPQRRLDLARQFVAGKIKNQRLILRRHGKRESALQDALRQYRHQALTCGSLDELRGIEGMATRVYFQALAHLFPVPFERRIRRPPRDPVNATLSLAYTLLLKDVLHLTHTVGLDPYLGYLHEPYAGRPALALDLMEEFRPLLADALVLSLWRRGQLKEHHFVREFGGVYLKESARKAFFEAYEKKKREELMHPRLAIKLPYFRQVELQIRLLGKVLLGELEAYPPFQPR